MNEILTNVKNENCSVCFVGTPFKFLNYDCSGTCMDYIYEKLNVPFSFAWEIYTNEKEFPEMNNYIKKFQSNSSKVSGFLEINSRKFEPRDV